MTVTNKNRLFAVCLSRLVIQPGDGIEGAINFIRSGEADRIKTINDAKEMVEVMIAAIKSAPDNPCGDDDEAIAGLIMKKIDERMNSRKVEVK